MEGKSFDLARLVSVTDANDHGLIHPVQAVSLINSKIYPWRLADIQFKDSGVGLVMALRIIDISKKGVLREDENGIIKHTKGADITFPLSSAVLPKREEIELLIETIRQEFNITSGVKIMR